MGRREAGGKMLSSKVPGGCKVQSVLAMHLLDISHFLEVTWRGVVLDLK